MTTIQLLEAMKNGAVLHMEWLDLERKFWLTGYGSHISSTVALGVITDGKVVALSDVLFPELEPQSFVHKESLNADTLGLDMDMVKTAA